MGKRPAMTTRLHKSMWGSWQRKVMTVTAVVIGLTGSITGIAASYPIVEPYFYVSRGALRLIVDKQALATDRQTLYQLKGDLDRANRDLATAPSQTVRERVDELQRAIRETESRVRKATGGQ